MSRPLSEIELASVVLEYFDGSELYKEQILGYNRVDIVAKTGPLITAIECKLQFSTEVIHQALRNFPHSNYSYVAVPKTQRSRNWASEKICKTLGVGVLYVQELYKGGKFTCGESIPPAYRRRLGEIRLDEDQKQAVAGAQHNTMSAFKITVRKIEDLVVDYQNRKQMLTIEKLFTEKFHWSTPRSGRQCFLSYVRKGILKQFSVDDRGRITLSKDKPTAT